MNVEEIKNTLDLAQCELRAAYKRLGYLNSNVLNSIDKCLADLSNQNNNTLVKGAVSTSTVDLSKCKKGDILISSHGAKLEYIAPTPWKHYTYLDHVVRYIEDVNGKSFGDENYGTRTNDGFTYAKNRKPETDHDIVTVL